VNRSLIAIGIVILVSVSNGQSQTRQGQAIDAGYVWCQFVILGLMAAIIFGSVVALGSGRCAGY
jgi:hypothetical protein